MRRGSDGSTARVHTLWISRFCLCAAFPQGRHVCACPHSDWSPLPSITFPQGLHWLRSGGTGITVQVHALIYLFCHLPPSRRGSTGFGQEALASLPGNIGTNDVLDCRAALQQAVNAGEGEVGGGWLEA